MFFDFISECYVCLDAWVGVAVQIFELSRFYSIRIKFKYLSNSMWFWVQHFEPRQADNPLEMSGPYLSGYGGALCQGIDIIVKFSKFRIWRKKCVFWQNYCNIYQCQTQ